ncbi:hypothetical protein [Bradyrhizobium sp. 195]|uniref:hypothetical protein n=1 Tax=Bradyrhizobium sp. 195 TaxID=2782662 RepID=UPI00200071E3|nr:hypothetical protein [Bradyrhizobium sp. 195]UPK31274.1 hypothetical protein IVB26_39815 [Bradyrhizobium sp. 195]
MRFYFSQLGDPPDQEGVEFDAEAAVEEAAQTALLLARDQQDVREPLTLTASSDEAIGTVTIKVSIARTPAP